MLLSFDEKSRKRKSLQVFSLVALLIVGVAVVKTTFAANISLNSGTAVEYGQGITQATACSGGSSLTLTPEVENQTGSCQIIKRIMNFVSTQAGYQPAY